MQIVIEGDAKEIAALVLAVQERQLEKGIAGEVITLLQKKPDPSEPVFRL